MRRGICLSSLTCFEFSISFFLRSDKCSETGVFYSTYTFIQVAYFVALSIHLSGSWVHIPSMFYTQFRLSGSTFSRRTVVNGYIICDKRIACSSFVCLGLSLIGRVFALCIWQLQIVTTSSYLIRLDLKLISFMISPHWLDLCSSECRRNYDRCDSFWPALHVVHFWTASNWRRLWEIFEYEVKPYWTRPDKAESCPCLASTSSFSSSGKVSFLVDLSWVFGGQ